MVQEILSRGVVTVLYQLEISSGSVVNRIGVIFLGAEAYFAYSGKVNLAPVRREIGIVRSRVADASNVGNHIGIRVITPN